MHRRSLPWQAHACLLHVYYWTEAVIVHGHSSFFDRSYRGVQIDSQENEKGPATACLSQCSSEQLSGGEAAKLGAVSHSDRMVVYREPHPLRRAPGHRPGPAAAPQGRCRRCGKGRLLGIRDRALAIHLHLCAQVLALVAGNELILPRRALLLHPCLQLLLQRLQHCPRTVRGADGPLFCNSRWQYTARVRR